MRSGPWPVILVLSWAVQGYLGGAQRRQDGHTKGETWGTRTQEKNTMLRNPSLVLAPSSPPAPVCLQRQALLHIERRKIKIERGKEGGHARQVLVRGGGANINDSKKA
jgi:hypothetical protein